MNSKIVFVVFIVYSIFSFSAIDTKNETLIETEKLNKPKFDELLNKVKSVQLPMSQRWQALLDSSEIANYSQIEEIKKFTEHKEWYLRNASLLALEKINLNHALEEAKKLVNDKALVVRSAAVDIIAKRYNLENRDILVSELNKPYNFIKNKSLWIRPKIFEILSAKATSDDIRFFARYLYDEDLKIVKLAVTTLEKKLDIHFDSKNQLQEWKNLVKKNGWL